jgi:hypothetical protein
MDLSFLRCYPRFWLIFVFTREIIVSIDKIAQWHARQYTPNRNITRDTLQSTWTKDRWTRFRLQVRHLFIFFFFFSTLLMFINTDILVFPFDMNDMQCYRLRTDVNRIDDSELFMLVSTLSLFLCNMCAIDRHNKSSEHEKWISSLWDNICHSIAS